MAKRTTKRAKKPAVRVTTKRARKVTKSSPQLVPRIVRGEVGMPASFLRQSAESHCLDSDQQTVRSLTLIRHSRPAAPGENQLNTECDAAYINWPALVIFLAIVAAAIGAATYFNF